MFTLHFIALYTYIVMKNVDEYLFKHFVYMYMQTSEVQIKNLKRGENKNTTMLVVLVSL